MKYLFASHTPTAAIHCLLLIDCPYFYLQQSQISMVKCIVSACVLLRAVSNADAAVRNAMKLGQFAMPATGSALSVNGPNTEGS